MSDFLRQDPLRETEQSIEHALNVVRLARKSVTRDQFEHRLSVLKQLLKGASEDCRGISRRLRDPDWKKPKLTTLTQLQADQKVRTMHR